MPTDLTILQQLADLLRERSAIDREIGALIERPVALKHIGDFLAAEIFDLTRSDPLSCLNDATFASGALAGKSLAIRWYPHHYRMLDLVRINPPDYYLALTGPLAASVAPHALTRPLAVHAVYLFDVKALHATLAARKITTGVGSLLDPDLWEAAEIYPRATSPLLMLTDEQRASIERFRFAETTL